MHEAAVLAVTTNTAVVELAWDEVAYVVIVVIGIVDFERFAEHVVVGQFINIVIRIESTSV